MQDFNAEVLIFDPLADLAEKTVQIYPNYNPILH